nr:PREDICTED: cathepsin B-like [Bemisia tabaci]
MLELTWTILLSVGLIHQTSGSDYLAELLKKHPTWSFELENVESFIQRTLAYLGSSDVDTEDMLRARVSESIPLDMDHIPRKIDDPKWVSPQELPDRYDARQKWKSCSNLLRDVQDEGVCHTDSPGIVSSVMADRYCIFTNGSFKEVLSQEMLVGCAEYCTQGSRLAQSWRYATSEGIPTGGGFNSRKGCLPYDHPPCRHTNGSYVHSPVEGGRRLKPCDESFPYDHDCPKQCTNRKYSKSLDADRVKLETWYMLSRDESDIRRDIFAYGPVATFIIFTDQLFDKPDGMYQQKEGRRRISTFKCLKLIGWGEESNVKFWLAVNSWDSWGNKVFKIPRGSNYDLVESLPTTGIYFK